MNSMPESHRVYLFHEEVKKKKLGLWYNLVYNYATPNHGIESRFFKCISWLNGCLLGVTMGFSERGCQYVPTGTNVVS